MGFKGISLNNRDCEHLLEFDRQDKPPLESRGAFLVFGLVRYSSLSATFVGKGAIFGKESANL